MTRKVFATLAVLVSLGASAPSAQADASLVCKYQAHFHSTDGRLFVGRFGGSFTEFTCVRARHDGSTDTLTLKPGSGATTGMISQLYGPNDYMSFGANSYARIDLVDSAGAEHWFSFYPQIMLAGRNGTIAGNVTGPGGWAAYGTWGTATLTSCVDVVLGACAEGWRIEGAITMPWWRDR